MMRPGKGLTFDDVLMVPAYSDVRSRRIPDTSVKLGASTFQIPLISANMDTITGSKMAITMAELGGLGILHRFMSLAANQYEYRQIVDAGHIGGISIGVSEAEFERACLFADAPFICVDVAHGHSKIVGQTIKKLRTVYNGTIIAGNVATYAGADYLCSCGADAVKVGIGPGSACTTRIKTGFGVPQLSAIMECSRVKMPIIADGGCRTPGDVVKALAAGASMVMLGGMLAGTAETPQPGVFRGMASQEAQVDYMGGMHDWKTAEGISTLVPIKGTVRNVIQDIVGGLRSGMAYAGAYTLEELQKRTEFIEVSPAGREESGPHILTLWGEKKNS